MMKVLGLLVSVIAFGCGAPGHGATDPTPGGGDHVERPDLADAPLVFGDAGTGSGCADPTSCYTVYAHGDHDLYSINLATKTLVAVGPFNAPDVLVSGKMVEDVITDLAVAPDNTIYVISHQAIYTASAKDGHVTLLGPLTDCGTFGVALTTMPDGNIYTADYSGAFCRIDVSMKPPVVTQVGSLGGGLAVAGDLVGVADGTMYATAYKLSDKSGGSANNNLLVKIDPSNGMSMTTIGSTGYPKLFGVAFAMGQVFGFTHDDSGDVITIDPKTGKGKLWAQFNDPSTGQGIAFAGAGVNSMVSDTIQ